MDLEVALQLGRTELVVGESAPVTITLTNTSDKPLTLPDPERSSDWPQIRLGDRQRQREEVFGPYDRGSKESHEFKVPLPPVMATLSPRHQIRREGDLMQWIGLPPPGSYELTAAMRWSGGQAASKPVALVVQPLNLRAAMLAGAHSGHTPFRYCVWSQAQGKGSAVILTSTAFDPQGHPQETMSLRVAELDYAALPVMSVSRNNFPYPAQWIAWLNGDRLSGLYVKQGQVALPLRTQAASVSQATLVGPILLEPDTNDDSRPARGHLALWQPGTSAANLVIRTFEANGALSAGPQLAIDSGELRWGRAVALAGGERRYLLAVQRSAGTSLEMARWNPATSSFTLSSIAQWGERSSVIGAGVVLMPDDRLLGAALIRSRAADGRMLYALQSWRVEADGTARIETALPIRRDLATEVERAVIELSPTGNIIALLRGADKSWFSCDRGGACAPLPAALAKFGEPIGAFWPNETAPFLIMAGAQTGITYRILQ
jgi:hypothetical protein